MEILVTRRLTLRPPLEVDVDDIVCHLQNVNVSRMLLRVPAPFDRRDAVDWVGKCQESLQHIRMFTIHRERLIGIAGVEDLGGSPLLGFWLAEYCWGMGLMREALGAMLCYLFDEFPDIEVSSMVMADNHASLKLQDRLGFDIKGAGEAFSLTRQAMVPVIRASLVKERFSGSAGSVHAIAA